MLAITARYSDKPDNGVYYVNKEFKDIFDKLGVSLFPVSSLMSLYDAVNLCQGLIVTGSPIVAMNLIFVLCLINYKK